MDPSRKPAEAEPLRGAIERIVDERIARALAVHPQGGAEVYVSNLIKDLPPGASSGVYRRAFNKLLAQGEPTLLIRGRAKLMPLRVWLAFCERETEKARDVAKAKDGAPEGGLLAELGARRVG